MTENVNVSESHHNDHPNTGPCPACAKTAIVGRCTWRDEFGVVHHFCAPACRAKFSRAPVCPKCKKRGVVIKVAVGHFPSDKYANGELVVPVAPPLCETCFEERGIPEHVLLTRYEGKVEVVS